MQFIPSSRPCLQLCHVIKEKVLGSSRVNASKHILLVLNFLLVNHFIIDGNIKFWSEHAIKANPSASTCYIGAVLQKVQICLRNYCL
jgi:hypothetical protein